MARLVLATLLVLAFLGALLVVGLGLRAVMSENAATTSDQPPGSPMQKAAFALLLALMVYVAFSGAS